MQQFHSNISMISYRVVSALLLCVTCLLVTVSPAVAQLPEKLHYPLDHRIPGKVGYWAGALGKASPHYFQPVRFNLPTTGRVTVFQGATGKQLLLPSAAQAGFLVGPMYRLKISNMPEYPGVELFPTIELIDRLHPPVGKEHEFPAPVEFSETEITAAINGNLVTKVIYLEQPQRAVPYEIPHPFDPNTLHPATNLIRRADREGRPMIIVRLGGRTPDKRGRDIAFFGAGAPVVPSSPPQKPLTGKGK